MRSIFFERLGEQQARRLAVYKASTVLLLVFAASLWWGCEQLDAEAQTSQSAAIQYIQPDDELGASMATVAGDVPLAHTAQFMALDEDSALVGAGDATSQAEQVLENAELALREVGSDLSDLLKINVYVVDNEVADEVRQYFAERFSGEEKPAVTYAVSRLPHDDALVAMDVVAVASEIDDHNVRVVRHVEGVGGSTDPERGHVAVMPPGGKVYLSGQIAEGEPIEAMRESLESQHDRLAYLGLSADDVIQVKVFMDDISDAGMLEDKIAEYYRNKPAPPIVSFEWAHPGVDAEVELIAARGTPPYDDEEAITYPTPAGIESFPQYSRAAEIHRGRIIYLSGLHGDVDRDAEGQIRDIFEKMEQILQEAGTDLSHLAKATYFVKPGDSEIGGPLGDIRADVYDEGRAPTSSLIRVESMPMEGTRIYIDMIGAIPE